MLRTFLAALMLVLTAGCVSTDCSVRVEVQSPISRMEDGRICGVLEWKLK